MQLDLSGDEDDTLTINRKYAQKFEQNKSREELSRLKNKYGEDDEDSDSETEDEAGDLATNDIEQGINKVLDTIRNHPERLKDKSLRFFPEVEEAEAQDADDKPKKVKPLTLKQYVLTQNNEDEEEKPETYAQEQARHKQELIDEINANDAGDDDDDFLTKRSVDRKVEPVALPDPEQDAQGFLNAFVSNKGWLDGHAYTEKNVVPSYQQVAGEESDEEDVDIAEKYESAYNFRFEDPSSTEIMSYARDQNTLRRKADSGRQKQREKERAIKAEEETQRQKDLARLRKLKVQQVTNRLEQIKQVLGDELVNEEDLMGDWNNDEWDQRMQRLFDEEYYKKHDKFEPKSMADLEKEFGALDEFDEADKNEEPEQASKGRDLKKLSKKELKRKAQEFVDSNEDLLKQEVYKPTSTFKYRTVEPESYGLTTEDILLADDRQLNMFVGLKKLASYRDEDKISKDKKRYGKKRRLRKWREEVWGSEDGPGDAWKKLKEQYQEEPRKKRKLKERKHKR